MATCPQWPLARKLRYSAMPNVSDRVMTVGIVMTVPNKFRLYVVLMFQIVITIPTVITLSLTLVCSLNLSLNKFRICSTTLYYTRERAQVFYTTIHPSPGRRQERKGVGLEPKQFQNHAKRLLGSANQHTVNASKNVQLLDMPRSINMIGEGFFNRHT